MINADIILLKFDANGKFLILIKGKDKAILAENEYDLFEKINAESSLTATENTAMPDYPLSVDEIVY